jgi:DNA-binding response OmpR family regulator
MVRRRKGRSQLNAALEILPPSGIDVLVIEDDPDLSSLMEFLLQEEGWSTQAAASGEDGLDLARLLQPSMVVLDFGLPGINGEEVAARMHALFGDIPILLVTADGRAREHARNAHAYAYLHKPFEIAAVIDAVSAGLALGQGRSHADLGTAGA